MPEGPKPSPPPQASAITLGELANYNADEWRRLTTEALARSRFAAVALAAAKGDDVVDSLGAVLGLLGRDTRCLVARVLERQLAEVMVQGAPPDETQVSRAHDILALLGSLNTPEALDAVSAVLDDKQKPLPLRLRAADTLVNCGVRLPRWIFEKVREGTAGALIGPVVEEMSQQDPRRCLEFMNSAKLKADEHVLVEYPLRQAAIDVGLPATVLLLDLTASATAGPMHQFFRDILAVEFGENALAVAISDAVANTGTKETTSTQSVILSDEGQGNLERDISREKFQESGLVLQSITGCAKSLVPPAGTLLLAVQHNLSKGVRYTFYVSKQNTDNIDRLKEDFLNALGPQKIHDDLVTVLPYKEDWAGNTLIFYFFVDPAMPQKEYKSMLTLVGSKRGDPLPSSWEIVSDNAGKTMLSLLDTPSTPSAQKRTKFIKRLREESDDSAIIIPIALYLRSGTK